MLDVCPRSVQAFIAWLENLLAVAAGLLTELAWEQAGLDVLLGKLAELKALYATSVTAKAKAKSATQDRQDYMKILMKEMRHLIAGIQINDKITDGQRESLGVKVRDTIPSHETPYIPDELEIEGLSNNANKVRFSSNKNKRGTLYIIEARYGTEGDFVQVASVLATKYLHKNQTPGAPVYYRVSAQRGQLVSLPCDPVGIYT